MVSVVMVPVPVTVNADPVMVVPQMLRVVLTKSPPASPATILLQYSEGALKVGTRDVHPPKGSAVNELTPRVSSAMEHLERIKTED